MVPIRKVLKQIGKFGFAVIVFLCVMGAAAVSAAMQPGTAEQFSTAQKLEAAASAAEQPGTASAGNLAATPTVAEPSDTVAQPGADSLAERFWKESIERLAGSSELYRERLEFDEEGNLWMTTRDRAATTSVRYRTIGFTIKREEKPIGQTMTVRVKLQAQRDSLTDPTDEKYRYNYFCIRKEDIYQKVLLCSEEWARELFLNGGMLYLDSIMTVVEDGVAKGSINYSGVTKGEVYETYEGISAARDWADPEAINTHFNKAVQFPGNPGMLDRTPVVEEYSELLENGSLLQEEDLPEWNELNLTSDTYEVEAAIPSGEYVTADGSVQKLYYRAVFEHVWGSYTFPVVAKVHYTLVWDEDGHHEESVTILDFYDVKRTYSYWKVKEISLYSLDYILLENSALCEQKRINSTYTPELTIVSDQEKYLILPEVNVEVEGGELRGGSRPPTIPYGEAMERVEEAIPEIRVNNDGFSLDGATYLKSGWVEKETDAPTALETDTSLAINEPAGQIRVEAANGSYPNTVTAYYKKVGGDETKTSAIRRTNCLEVHTPVVCRAAVSDEKGRNQQVVPTAYASLILGRNFTVQISAEGEHISQKGYGTQDYGRYVKDYQVRFPFPVRYGTQEIAADCWISLKEKNTTFYLPIAVEEGDVTISFRTIAVNCGADETAEEAANRDRSYAVAKKEVAATVVGRLYGFKITNIIDYPRWQSVFWNVAQKKRTGTCYYAGYNDCDGVQQRTKDSLFLCPILKGSHPYNSNAGVVGLGYRVNFSFETIGHRTGKKMGMSLTPTYYYMERDGSGRRQVRLYEKESLEELAVPFSLSCASEKETGKLTWTGSCLIPADVCIVPAEVDLTSYLKKKGGRISLRDDIFLRDGYLIVNVGLTSRYGTTPHLSYRNPKNEKAGYCNMWQMEGFLTTRTDSEGTTFSFSQGDVFVFDCCNTIWGDYDTYGTH